MNLNATLLGQMITFLLFAGFAMKFVWPPMMEVLEGRRKKIADGLEAATRAGKDLDLAQARAADMLRDAKTNAAGIIDSANKRANQIIDEAKDKAREEGQRIKAGAQAEIEQQVSQAREQLRKQVAVLAVAGAEKILQSSVDAKAHGELLNKLAASL